MAFEIDKETGSYDDTEISTRAEWDAKYGKIKLTGEFDLQASDMLYPMLATVVVTNITLIDGHIVAAKGGHIRYGVREDTRNGKKVVAIVSDDKGLSEWPYPQRLKE